jgi:hypothetical protein
VPGRAQLQHSQRCEGLIQWTCETANDGQQRGSYEVGGGSDNRYEIKNLDSGTCLAMPNSSTADGTEAIQWTCENTYAQLWPPYEN